MIIAPLLAAMLVFFWLRTTPGAAQRDWRVDFLSTCVAWGLLVIVITEGLSLFGQFTAGGVFALWVIVDVAFGLILLRRGAPGFPHGVLETLKAIPAVWTVGAVAVVGLVGLTAVIAPPNNFDSMTYHMPRVVHWIQDQSVDFFATSATRQLYQPPLEEYMIAHLQLLTDQDDHLANSVQWFSMVASVIGVSFLAKRMGGDLIAQALAAVICVTLPMGIVQGSSTQSNYVVVVWFVSLSAYLLAFNDAPTWPYALGIGSSLGLAIATKGTTYALVLPFLFWLFVRNIRQFGLSHWRKFAVMGLIALALNMPLYLRNLSLNRQLLGAASNDQYSNALFTPAALASNVVRNVALQLATPIPQVNAFLQDTVLRFHQWLGLDASDPRTTMSAQVFSVLGWQLDEDHTTNLAHTLLIGLCAALFLIRGPLRSQPLLRVYGLVLLLSFLAFCLIFRWQPWQNRLLFVLFVLAAPLMALILAQTFELRSLVLLGIVLFVISAPWALRNPVRPLVGPETLFNVERTDWYFGSDLSLLIPNLRAIDAVNTRGCQKIGLTLSGDSYEYPFWVLIKHSQIEHILVTNISAKLERTDFVPCAILSDVLTDPSVSYAGFSYTRIESSGKLNVYMLLT